MGYANKHREDPIETNLKELDLTCPYGPEQ